MRKSGVQGVADVLIRECVRDRRPGVPERRYPECRCPERRPARCLRVVDVRHQGGSEVAWVLRMRGPPRTREHVMARRMPGRLKPACGEPNPRTTEGVRLRSPRDPAHVDPAEMSRRGPLPRRSCWPGPAPYVSVA